MPTEPEWAALQKWLVGQIIGDAAPRDEKSATAELDLHDVIRGSRSVLPEQRLTIYARSYALRLIECLREEFPTLRLFVGDQVFDLFAGAYIANRPSRSYSLYDLGAAFADFLDATRPEASAGRQSIEAIPATLARLERAISEAQRAVGIETMSDAAPPIDALLMLSPDLRLRLPDTTRLLRLDFDFADALAAARHGECPDLPPARDTYAAVARSHYRVRVYSVTPTQFAWLQALGSRGDAIHDAIAAASRTSSQDAGAIIADLMTWLPKAVGAGLVIRS